MGLPKNGDVDNAGNMARVVPVQNGYNHKPVTEAGETREPEGGSVQLVKQKSGVVDSKGKVRKSDYWIHSDHADWLFGGWIVFNALVLAIETDARTEENEDHAIWLISDSLFNTVFLVEMLLRMRAEGSSWPFDIWNIFDFVLVAIGIVDSWLMPILGLDTDVRFATLLRLLRLMRLVRILRVLRLFRFLKELMLLVAGITSAMKAMVWGLLLLAITIFICAMFMTKVVGKACCEEDDTFQNEAYKEYFGTLARTAFTLFQFTMEFQPDICRETWEDGPYLTFFFLAYTMFTNITLLNTVASVIVEDILRISQEHEEEKQAFKSQREAEELSARLEDAFASADSDGDKMLSQSELLQSSNMDRVLNVVGVDKEQAKALFFVMDADRSGKVSREEFNQRLVRINKPPDATDLLKVECHVQHLYKKLDDGMREMRDLQKTIVQYLARIETRQDAVWQEFQSADAPVQDVDMRPHSREGWSDVEDITSQPGQPVRAAGAPPPAPNGVPSPMNVRPYNSGDDAHFFV